MRPARFQPRPRKGKLVTRYLMDLHLYLPERDYASKPGIERNPQLVLNQGDVEPLRVFIRDGTGGTIALPAPYTLIKLNGRPADNSEGIELFKVVELNVTEDSDGIHYDGVINLNTSTINTALGSGATAIDNINVVFQVQFSNADANPKRFTPITRGLGILYRDLYREDDAPTVLDPEYPSAASIALKQGANYRIVNGILQIKNVTTNAYHAVHLKGATGIEQLVIESAS
jgi:hypothetical protein